MKMKCPIHPQHNGIKKPDYICYRCWETYIELTKPEPILFSPGPNMPTIRLLPSGTYNNMLASPESYPPNWCSTCAGQLKKTGQYFHCEDKSSWFRGPYQSKIYYGGCTINCPPHCPSLHPGCKHLNECKALECDHSLPFHVCPKCGLEWRGLSNTCAYCEYVIEYWSNIIE